MKINQICKITLLVIATYCFTQIQTQAQNDNYGADAANKRFIPSLGTLGGRTDFNYLNLENHPARSGVPLGGIGVGNVEFAPDGRFVRIGMNNIHIPKSTTRACFFTLWQKKGGNISVKRLVRDDQSQYNMDGIKNTYYRGLFPTVELNFGKEFQAITPKINAYSGLVPHNIKDSSLPVVYFDVQVESSEDTDAAIAFSWEDLIGKGLKEPKSIEGMDGQIFSGNGREKLLNGEQWPAMEAVSTFSEFKKHARVQGVHQFASSPLIPIKATFQNYIQEVAILAETQEGMEISSLPSFDINSSGEGWNNFIKDGSFAKENQNILPLSVPGKTGGSAIAVKTHLKAGEKKTIRFMLVWYCDELKIDKENAASESYWKGGSDYGKYFHNFFDRIEQVIDYGYKNRARILKATKEWQEPILSSTLPDWYKFKVINSAYVIYTNMILNKKGDVTVNEGGMGGLAGTMDQRISSHPFYQKFFTQLDRSEMDIFADAQAANGSISHFIGHYYVGMGTVGGRIPTENNWMLDNTEGWIIQLAKDYEQTGDLDYLKKYVGRVKDGMAFVKSKMPEGLEIPVGPTTYDDFTHPPVYSYGAGMYLASLKATQAIAEAVCDTPWIKECKEQFDRSQKDMIRLLWNGRFFSYGCEIDGSKRLDNILFTGQLAGEFVSRYCGWGDILPMDILRSSLISQFKISLSNTPDYYANKVWDIDLGKGIDQRGSQCWPFYLESYTAYTALQAGYLEDAMDIMKHIQLVHLRKGWTWCQNLWNPAELNYMTAPVTWFSTDLFAGAGLNIPRKELRLAPIITGKEKILLPLFYPKFWATLSLDPKSKKASLTITKTFGNETIEINKLVVEAMGKPTSERTVISIPGFEISRGNTLDLTKWWSELTDTKLEKAVLPQADKVEFMHVNNMNTK